MENTANTEPQGPRTNVRVDLSDVDGNAFCLIGAVSRALRKAGYRQDFIDAFRTEALAGDYTHLLATILDYVEID